MRIPAVLALTVLLSTPTVYAQDLQFRTVTTSEAMGLAIPGFTMNVAIKGQLTRIDMDVAGMWFSSIVDHGAQKMLMINHEEMTYSERPGMVSTYAAGSRPQLRESGETQEIAGFKAKRIVMTSILPGGEDLRRALLVQEMWVVSDTKLAQAFGRYIRAMAASGKASASGHLFGDIPEGTFPLRITLLVVAANPGEKINADALLNGTAPSDRIQMQTVMVISDIRTTEVDPSFFVVPTGYVKSSR